MGGKSKSQIIGFRYYMGLHFAMCYGPVDALRRILVGDRRVYDETFYDGEITYSRPLYIPSGGVFGGDDKEGGILGYGSVCMGEPTQEANAYLQAQIGADIPAYRGIFSFVFEGGQVSANNPYIKPWSFDVRRIKKGWNNAGIDGSANYLLPWLQALDPRNPKNEHEYRPFSRVSGALTADPWSDDLESLVDTLNTTGGAGGVPYDFPQTHLVGIAWNDSGTWRYVSPTDEEVHESIVDQATVYFLYTPQPPDNGFVDLVDNDGYPTVCDALSAASGAVNSGETFFWTSRFDGEATSAPFGGLYSFYSAAPPDWSNTNGCPFFPAGGLFTYFPGADRIMVIAVRRKDRSSDIGGDCWYPEKAEIGIDMNPAHIIYQCLTDTVWGMGYPVAQIDDTNFRAAADALYDEGFGLSLMWNRQDEIRAFVRIITDHIGAVSYSDPATGQFKLKLIRGGYDVESLPEFDETNIVSFDDYQRLGYGETVNEINVVYRDRETAKDASITVQDLANIQAQGGVVSQTRQYPGLPTAALAGRVAERDLLASSTPLAKAKVTINRNGWDRAPGDVVKVTWPKLGLTGVIFRVLAVDYGTLQDGKIVVDIAEDVFGLPDSTYAAQEPIGWVEPDTTPTPVAVQEAIEAPYWHVSRTLPAADLAQLDDDSAFNLTLAKKPFDTASYYTIQSRTGSNGFSDAGAGSFAPTATLGPGLSQSQAVVALSDLTGDAADFIAGKLLMVGAGRDAEWMLIKSVDGLGNINLARGVLDTVPQAHAAGVRLWVTDDALGFDETERTTGEEVDLKVLPNASLEDEATPMTITDDARFGRPYPPGKFKINGESYPASVTGSPITVTWTHRNRLQQTAYVVEQEEGNIGPESGVTYNLRIIDADTDAVLEQYNGLSGVTYTSAVAGFFNIRVELEAERDDLVSWQAHNAEFAFADGLITTEDSDFLTTEDGNYLVVQSIPVNYTFKRKIEFSGTLDPAEVLYFSINGTIYVVNIAGKTTLDEIATDLAAQLNAASPPAIPAQKQIFAEGGSVFVMLNTTVPLGAYNNTIRSVFVQTVQDPKPVTGGTTGSRYLDFYDSNGILSPEFDDDFEAAGTAGITVSLKPRTYALTKTLPTLSVPVSWSYTISSNYYLVSLADAVDSIQNDTDLQAAGITAGTATVTPQMSRAGVVMFFQPGDDYIIAGASIGSSPSGYRIEMRTASEGSTAYPSGAKQMDTVRFNLNTPLEAGEKFTITLDGADYTYTATSGDASNGTITPIFNGLKPLIEASGLYTATLYGQAIEIERNTINTAFVTSARAGYGITTTITNL